MFKAQWGSRSTVGDKQMFPKQDGSALGQVCLKYGGLGRVETLGSRRSVPYRCTAPESR